MSSPVVSSPLSISRRQSLSPSEISIDASSIRHPRHSPTLTRSFDPNDPQVRERQRTMDVDMAMQLSLARRDTLHSSPVNTFSSPATLSGQQQGSADHPFAPLSSENEENRLLEGDEGPLQDTPFEMNDEEHDHENGHSSPRLDRETDADNMDMPGLGHLQNLPPLHRHRSSHSLRLHIHPEDPQGSNFGLPTYQATNASQSNLQFNFQPMEEWAATEKTRLGLNSSPLNTRFSMAPRPKTVDARPQVVSPEVSTIDPTSSTTMVPPTEDGPSGSGQTSQAGEQPTASTSTEDPARPLRFRKLSQSNPHPRSHRKGIGGKMALFESNLNDAPSFSARLGLVLGNQGGPITTEPSYEQMHNANSVGGILNTGHDRPYRFSFYSNALSATIHARSLSELPAEGQTFEQLFSGINPSTAGGGPTRQERGPPFSPPYTETMRSTPGDNAGSYFPSTNNSTLFTNHNNGNNVNRNGINGQEKAFGGGGGGGMNGGPGAANEDASTWWLDVLNPTDEEMKMLSKVFNIHPLTTEDILMEETREKIELFRNYYLVCFRSFDQDPYSPTHLEPLNMYIIVFRQGTLSFHFRPTPHPQNVRRRIKQLKDYISVTSDWISYALIDDITDAFGPLIQGIEYEVDSIDELVLILKEAEQSDMLRRIGTCRKKVMGLLRLMGNKADVVKGLAKRCNENWRVAPTSDIGLYLSDIQDHLITMTQNLNHYEKILSRSHSNYLAQISIEMTDANNQINDVLSKMTALGTVLVPMNLVTGLWGMNVHVPGEDAPGYAWFISIIACLAAFALFGGYSTYRFLVRK